MNDDLMKLFSQPPSEYRAAPFWAWNATIEPEECRRQIRLMHQMGMGGFFMHARVGLNTAYLSDAWFECVDACLDEADKLDMQAWLYDEDRWPSGAAGGLVTANREYRMQSVVMQRGIRSDQLDKVSDIVAVFAAKLQDDNKLLDYRRICKNALVASPKESEKRAWGMVELEPEETLLVFRVALPKPSPWYNGATYLDTLNPDAVAAYIESTHESYRKRYSERFGKRIPGIFTDEPHYGGVVWLSSETELGSRGMPWTGKLTEAFEERYGYDLCDFLPTLFLPGSEAEPQAVRLHYVDLLTSLFVDSFARQIGDWCEQHNLVLTGHVLAEESIKTQANRVGSALRFYEHMQAPGMDILTERNREWDTAKGVSSVARQFGRKWRLTETYGCTGWDFNFAGHKAIGDWQVALGINLRCPHLSWYSMRGEAKRDYPAGIFYQSPWWEWYPLVENYFARIHAVMTRGTEQRDILLLYPCESAWLYAHFDDFEGERVAEISATMRATRDRLLAAHLDFDYGDEDILARHAKIVQEGTEPLFEVAQARYRAVVVPLMETMRSSTLERLKDFKKAGGTVVFAAAPAPLLDGEPSGAVADFAAGCPIVSLDGPDLAAALEPVRRISIADQNGAKCDGVLYLLREDTDAAYLFIANTGCTTLDGDHGLREPMVRDRTVAWPEVKIRGLAGFAGQPLELDPTNGTRWLAATATDADGNRVIETSLPQLGSRLFVIPRQPIADPPPPLPQWTDRDSTDISPAKWDFRRTEANLVVLDSPTCRIGDIGDWQPAQEILRVDRFIRDTMGIEKRGGQMVQPWKRQKSPQPKTCHVQLRYNFEVETLPQGTLHLALESPEKFIARLNGKPIETNVDCGWWCDKSLRLVALDAAALQTGSNQLELELEYDEDFAGLEIVYILGDFGVELRGRVPTLTPDPTSGQLGDWVPQGLSFYAGSLVYETSIELQPPAPGQRTIIRLENYRGVAARVWIDGQPAGITAWPPGEVDITPLLPAEPRSFKLGIEIMGHRRNSHGPLHFHDKWPAWTGPAEFVSTGENWQDDYQLVPVGLMEPPRLVLQMAES